MVNITDPFKCSGCGACVAICPTDCISLRADEEGFLYPKVDMNSCLSCSKCESICPFAKETSSKEYQPIVAAAKAKNDALRYVSSSGGIFSLLAENCLHEHGVVCGAAMTKDCRGVHHVMVEDYQGLSALRGSKYIPSDMGDIFIKVRSLLDEGRRVLFSGVSCQVAGLKSFLGKEYDNLFTVEIICHGVPSPVLWEKYIKHWELANRKKVKEVYFRSKKISWQDFGEKYVTNEGEEFFQLANYNPYFLMFNSGMALRKSCYKCKVKQGNSKSDISIGDFWHIEDYAPEFADNKGVSLVLINSDQGKQWFNLIKNQIDYIIEPNRFTFDDVAKYNPGVKRSLGIDEKREMFYSDLNRLSMRRFIKKYTPLTYKQKIKEFLIQNNIWDIVCKFRGGGGYEQPGYGVVFICECGR